jgi:hypothetical protein
MWRFLTRGERWVKAGWVLPLALVALPNCSFHPGVAAPQSTSAMFCDMRVTLQDRRCATATDLAMGIRLSEAAIALAQGKSSSIGIDDRPDALGRCGGQPEAVTFRSKFPNGTEVCFPGSFFGGEPFTDAAETCVTDCLTFLNSPTPPDPVLVDFCRQRTHPSTGSNAPFDNACTSAGNPVDGWPDPRLSGDVVGWQNQANVVIVGGDIQRATPAANNLDFHAGGASTQLVTSGDGYLEFTAAEGNTARLGGLTTGDGAADLSIDFATIGGAVDLFADGHFYVFENGTKQPGPDNTGATPGAWGTYMLNDRFRIAFSDNFDGTATISYAKLPGPCSPGADCPAPPFFTSPTHLAYPFHVDAALRDLGATLIDVRLVFIH